jgi:hypothetical protein
MTSSPHTRRVFAGLVAGAAAVSAQQSGMADAAEGRSSVALPSALLLRAEDRCRETLGMQITGAAHAERGGYADQYGLVTAHSGGGVVATLGTAFLYPQSRYHLDAEVLGRLKLAAEFLQRKQLPSGNIDLVTTNFDSPPDTAFVVHNVAPVAILAKRAGHDELVRMLMPFLLAARRGMVAGGVHTPNHRWVICSALALVHALEPHEPSLRRIDQWLAEGVDIDEDGLYTERSPLVYTPVVNRSFIYMAEFAGKADLLQPVRQSLQAALQLMHPNGELVTELSGRQDQNVRGDMGVNWLALQYLAAVDRNAVYAGLASRYLASVGDPLQWMLVPRLAEAITSAEEPPSVYTKDFQKAAVWRWRKDDLSLTLLYRGYDRLLALRRGEAVVEALRMSSAFFGKGQFVAREAHRDGHTWVLTQQLEGPYFQPLEPPQQIPSDPMAWAQSRHRRQQSEVAKYEQRLVLHPLADGLRLELSATGTPNVPVSVELNVRDGVEISGVRTGVVDEASFLSTGEPIHLRKGRDLLRVVAPASTHAYTQLRGASPRLPGRSVYITGLSPFRATIEIS